MTGSEPRPPLALIAEDSRIQAKVLERRLMQAGYAVRVAFDGAAAVDMAREQKPDVIVSDIEMPKMSGYDFCRAVKQDPRLRDVPVILLSTLADAEDIIRGLDAGADNYVTKPYDPAYLLARIEAVRSLPLSNDRGEEEEIPVTLAGRTYKVRSGRQQALNLLVSTFENAVEKNRELHRMNEQLTLAKEKLSQWNTELQSLNQKLETANERMSRDLHAAARVQQSLLPAGRPEIAGVELAWKYTPCEELAGDFLNCFPLDDTHVAMYVVDVSGHGAASSLLAVAISRMLTSHSSPSSLLSYRDPMTGELRVTPPSKVAEELNRRFPMEAQDGLYFTICYAVLNTKTGLLRYVSGGHPPLVHLPKGGKPAFLGAENLPIGIAEDIPFDEAKLEIGKGDRIYFYSDGVPEGMNERLEQFTDERMMGTLKESASQPLGESVAALFDAVGAWCAVNGPRDDISILGVELVPLE
jgi:sigma-B regulation protein RsbU (phosphoserine phosphatase)